MIGSPEAALADAGIPCDNTVTVDGLLHRYRTKGDHDSNSWYVFHARDGIVCGAFGCWKRQFTTKWSNIEFSSMTPDQKKAARLSWQEAAEKQKKEQEKVQSEARAACAQLVNSLIPAKSHPYLSGKMVHPSGRVLIAAAEHVKGWLAIPLQDEKGAVHSFQFIADDGTKRFFYGGRVQGCYFPIEGKMTGPILICEGYATGASIFEATGWTVLCAMNCGNLLAVCQAARKLYPDRTIVICADNDQFTEGNPGVEKAKAAARPVSAAITFPEFSDESLAEKPTDFNDLHRIEGAAEVRVQINRAFTILARPIGDFELPPDNDPTELLKHRFLCERGSLLLTGPTGVGKSSFNMQALALWSNCLPFFGITPAKPLTSILIQAENDDGDIAEMRNGICTGLNFTENQRKEFFQNVLVFSSNGVTGRKFCEEVLRPLLDLYPQNLVCIDPALSFMGGDVKEQKDVGSFLRQHINPQLFAHNCASMMVHHTNKPKSGNEETAPLNGDWAYQGSGSAEWANWARAVLSLQSSGTPGVYKLHAGKRAARIGWRDSQDQIIFEKIIIHSREKGVICWEEGDKDDLPDRGRPNTFKPNELVQLLGSSGLSTTDWQKRCFQELGVSRAQFHRIKTELATDDLVFHEKSSGKWVQVNKT